MFKTISHIVAITYAIVRYFKNFVKMDFKLIKECYIM